MSNVHDIAEGFALVDELGFNGPLWLRAKERAGYRCGNCNRHKDEGAVLVPELLVRANRYGEMFNVDLRVRCEQCVGSFPDGVAAT